MSVTIMSELTAHKMQLFEVIRVNAKRVACDGGGGGLGHPRVWLNLGEDDQIECPYCSRLYVMAGSDADHALEATMANANEGANEAEENGSA